MTRDEAIQEIQELMSKHGLTLADVGLNCRINVGRMRMDELRRAPMLGNEAFLRIFRALVRRKVVL